MNLNPKDLQIEANWKGISTEYTHGDYLHSCIISGEMELLGKVMITHKPTGIRVHGNSREEAMKELANQFDKIYNIRLDYPETENI